MKKGTRRQEMTADVRTGGLAYMTARNEDEETQMEGCTEGSEDYRERRATLTSVTFNIYRLGCLNRHSASIWDPTV